MYIWDREKFMSWDTVQVSNSDGSMGFGSKNRRRSSSLPPVPTMRSSTSTTSVKSCAPMSRTAAAGPGGNALDMSALRECDERESSAEAAEAAEP